MNAASRLPATPQTASELALQTLLSSWKVPDATITRIFGETIAGQPTFYDSGGNVLKDEDVKGDGRQRVTLAAIGVSGVASVYAVKTANESTIRLMESLHRKRTAGNETNVCYYSPEFPLPTFYRLSPLPDPFWKCLLGKIADGGLSAGVAAFCALLGFLITRLAGFAISGQGACLSAAAALVGLLLGGLAQWAGRRYGSQLSPGIPA
jgi:hypothetical protein